MTRIHFFFQMGPYWDRRTQTLRLIALTLSFKFIGAIQESSLLTDGNDVSRPHLFDLLQIHPDQTQGLHPHLFQSPAFI